ncbi:MAG: DUF1080 domain-containing protein [Pedosphaera sp.]|nr:DUF1080 domain-containing protein [Pedosphaera sp.]
MKRAHVLVTAVLLAAALTQTLSAADGVLPRGKDGKPLNFDFETGTLQDWSVEGDACDGQPVHGDKVAARRTDMKSNHAGEYWFGTFEAGGDKPQGKLKSVPFRVTAPFASFLVGGGSHEATRVELVVAGSKEVIFQISGENDETMRPVVVDLSKHTGKNIFIRVIDNVSGGWGHINFDDFKLHEARPKFANERNPAQSVAKAAAMPPLDVGKFAGLSGEEAAKGMTLPPGFKATLFAGEPDVQQPIAFAIDDRGRLWVAEGMTYPIRQGASPIRPVGQTNSEPTADELKSIFGGKDRILVFEDTDGDGKFNKRSVFAENLNLVSGIELGFGGVYVGAAPYLMFIPMTDGDEPKPVGKPQILLDGWDYKRDTHETLNTFTWGPDGWLYGCHGVFCPSHVGKPGAPERERQWMDAGVWRYHPTKHLFEVFAEGTSNPWGIDFDEHGQCWIEACVIPHLFHMIQGGRYQRQGGDHFSINREETARNESQREKNSRKPIFPYAFDDIKTVADHVHYAGDKGPHAGNARSGAVGGGHAHAGLMIYQGDNWPAEYRGKIFMNNIHGARINMDVPERAGSGFVGHHGADFINFNDKWSQILNLQTGPDGAVYLIDWYDKNECHHNDPNGHDRSNGRIFKINDEKPYLPSFQGDILTASNNALMGVGLIRNDWSGRHARRILQERFSNPTKEHELFINAFFSVHSGEGTVGKLNWIWMMHLVGGLKEDRGLVLLRAENEYGRAWTIQFLCEDKKVPEKVLKEFARLSREDKSPIVRLYLASAMQRLPVADRWEVIEALSQRAEDANDHNIPLMVWYATEPLVAADTERALKLAENAKLPNLLNFTVRRAATLNTPEAFAAITKSLLRSAEPQLRDILNGLSTALADQRKATAPAGWEAAEAKLSAVANPEIRALAQSLSLKFGSARALASLRTTLMDKSADGTARKTALDSLLAAKDAGLPPLLQQLLTDANLQGPALRGLALFDDAKTPDAILLLYTALSDANKREARNTLASRATFAKQLLAAVEAVKIPKNDLTADLVQQLRNLKNEDVDALLVKVWGVARASTGDKLAEIERFKKIYRAGGSQPGDAPRGRVIFAKVCQQCHTLFGTGGRVGPELTGSNRGDLDYILQNIVDPNAVIPNDYRAWNIETKDSRSISGVMKEQNDLAVTVVTATETITIPRNEISTLQQSQLSMMPEGLLTPLAEQEVRDLIFYLRQPGQVPLLATPESAALFFNGKDLANWDGDTSLWKVEHGEIVGQTDTGLKHNEFLKSQFVLSDFRLVCKVKLTPNSANSGIQFRSEPFGDHEMKGCQADMGQGWWGKLYEESGRGLLATKPCDEFVKKNDWNVYEILAVGGKIRTALNGNLCTDLDDPQVAPRGITGLQVHSGGPTEVRFKDFELELNPKFELKTVK